MGTIAEVSDHVWNRIAQAERARDTLRGERAVVRSMLFGALDYDVTDIEVAVKSTESLVLDLIEDRDRLREEARGGR